MTKKGYTPPALPEEESIIFGDEGTTALTHLQSYLFSIIRRSMNRRTGIAGKESRISYGGLYERAYEPARPGYGGTGDDWGETREQRIDYVRNQVRKMVTLGLIKLVSKKGGPLEIEFVIFNQYRDLYFSGKNKLTTVLPLEDTGNLPDTNPFDNSDLGGNDNADFGDVTIGKPEEVTALPEVSRGKDTTTTPREKWKSDPLAAAMLAGGMNEYHVATGMHLVTQWRMQANFSEEAMASLIKARLAQNKNINSVKYFNAIAVDACQQPDRNIIPFKKKSGGIHANSLQPTNIDECPWLSGQHDA